ncbi:MAG: type II toxin-antitoxin system Phd/YefM family antitoxin [Longimicrobiales bacterium]
MKKVGAYEAKTHFAALLDRVQKGERISITRHGRVVAVLAPPPGGRDQTVQEAISTIIAFRRGRVLGEDFTVRDLIDAGRR